jgi:signal transduction histidine kinase
MLGAGVRALRKTLRPGIRGRLLLLTLPAVNLVFAAIWLVVTTTARDRMLSLSGSNLQAAATSLADTVDQAMLDAYTDAMTAAHHDITMQAIASRDPRNLAWFADELVRSKKRYAAIVVSDPQGLIVASSTIRRNGGLGPPLIGRRLPDQRWVKELLRGPDTGAAVRIPLGRPPFLEGAIVDDEQVLGVGMAVNDRTGKRIGALAVLLSSAYLSELLEGQVLRSESSAALEGLALITDSSGALLMLPRSLRGNISWTAPGLVVPMDPEQADALWVGPGNSAFLHRSRSVPAARKPWDLQIVALRTLARVEAPVQQLSGRLFVAFLFGSILTTGILFVVATRFVGPIQRLTAAASRTVRAADFEPIPVETTDEVGVLTAGFNRMLSDLKEYQVGLEHKVEERTRELAQAKQEVTDILDNMQQAVFTCGSDGVIGKEVSAHTREIFGNVEIAGQTLVDVLQLEQVDDLEKRARMGFWLSNIFGVDELQWMLTETDRLSEMTYRRPMSDGSIEERLLKIEYAPIYKLGAVDRVMVIVKDVTEFTRLRAEVTRQAEENRRNLERASQIAAMDPELFDTFSGESEFLLAMAEALLAAGETGSLGPDVIQELFRVVHTFKGNARIFKLAALQEAAHAAEEVLGQARNRAEPVGPPEIAEIRAHFVRLRQTLEELKTLAAQVLRRQFDNPAAASGPLLKIPEAKVLQLRQSFKAIGLTATETNAHLPRALHDRMEEHGRVIRELTMVRIADVVLPLQMMARDLARELGKSITDVEITGAELLVDARILTDIKEILLHALRNAIDHGLETPEQRAAANKPSEGRILLRCEQRDDRLVIAVEDDGRGIDRQQVKARAIEQRLVSRQQAETLADEDVLDLLFRPGFSTRKAVSATSGRGVGMDVIRAKAADLHGTAQIASTPGRGATLTLTMPAGQGLM